VHSWVASS